MSSLMSAKTRYIKLQSSTDRVQGDLNACTFDLTSATFLQNCKGAQLLGAGFTQLTPNVREDENTVIIQTNDTSIVVLDLPPTNINLNGNLNITIPPPPAGLYTPQEWVTEVSNNVTTGIQNTVGTFTADVVVT